MARRAGSGGGRFCFPACAEASAGRQKTTLVSCANTPQLCLGEWRDLFYFLCKIVLRIFLPFLEEISYEIRVESSFTGVDVRTYKTSPGKRVDADVTFRDHGERAPSAGIFHVIVGCMFYLRLSQLIHFHQFAHFAEARENELLIIQ